MNVFKIMMFAALASGCAIDDDQLDQLDEIDSEVIGTNQLSAAQLANSKTAASQIGGASLSSNSAALQALVSTVDGRATMTVIVGCALPAGQSVMASDTGGTSYTFNGQLNLAPNWRLNVPTTADKKWTTACVMARTNANGLAFTVSLRHDTNLALSSTAPERAAYPTAEAGFYGNLFQVGPVLYACASQIFAPSGDAELEALRACARSQNGITTNCGFSYTWLCGATLSGHVAACVDKTAPYGSCKGAGVTYAEVVTSFSAP